LWYPGNISLSLTGYSDSDFAGWLLLGCSLSFFFLRDEDAMLDLLLPAPIHKRKIQLEGGLVTVHMII